MQKKGIVIAHSFRNTFEQPVCLEAAKKFFEEGYAVLVFNFLGHGRSGGSLRDVSFRTTSENVASAIKYLRGKNIAKIGVYAVSLGTIATVLSKEHPDAQFFISPSPLYNPRGLLERYSQFISPQQKEILKKGYAIVTSRSGRGDFEMGEEWINEMENENGKIKERYISNKVPTLIIQGTKDELERLGGVKDFIDSTNTPYFSIQDGDHELTNPEHRENVISKAIDYFNKTLVI